MQIRCGSCWINEDGETVIEEWTEEVADTFFDDMWAAKFAAPKPDVMLVPKWVADAVREARD